jgi:hypothetical protein
MRTSILILAVYFPLSLLSQNTHSFCVGAIGMLSSGNPAQSLAQSFTSKASCLQVQTGIQVHQGILGRLPFAIDCNTAVTITPFSIRLFPNPVINYVRIDGAGAIGSNENCLLAIIDATGRLLFKESTTIPALRSGISYFWGWLKSGSYFLKVDGETIHQIVPFVKIN